MNRCGNIGVRSGVTPWPYILTAWSRILFPPAYYTKSVDNFVNKIFTDLSRQGVFG